MARRPIKAKPGKPVRMQIIFPGELVALVDAHAKKMTEARPFEPAATRTDALRTLVIEALKKHGAI